MALIFSMASNHEPYRFYYQPAVVFLHAGHSPKKKGLPRRGHSGKADCSDVSLPAGNSKFPLVSFYLKTTSRELTLLIFCPDLPIFQLVGAQYNMFLGAVNNNLARRKIIYGIRRCLLQSRLHAVLSAIPEDWQIFPHRPLRGWRRFFLFSRQRFSQPQGNLLPKLSLKAKGRPEPALIINTQQFDNIVYFIF